MNIFETIYCSQYYELKKTGRDPLKGRLNGTLLNATIILLAAISIGILTDHFSSTHFLSHFFRFHDEDSFSARSTGRLLGLVGIALVGGGLHVTYGSEANYKKMAMSWDELPEPVLENTIKSGLKIFGVVFGFFLLVVCSTLV